MGDFTGREIKESIIYFGEKYGSREVYEVMVERVTLPEMVRIIVLEMFTNRFFENMGDLDDRVHYERLVSYSRERSEVGYVRFRRDILDD